MDAKKKDFHVEDNIERMSKLPEEYIKAIEDITDSLSKDWKNKLISAKYISYLCDVFEKAIVDGKSAQEAMGMDPFSYAKWMEKELDLVDVEPTVVSSLLNIVVICDFIIFFGAYLLMQGSSYLQGDNDKILFLILGAIVISAAQVFKYIRTRSMNVSILMVMIEFAITFLILYFMKFSFVSVGIVLIVNILIDYLTLSSALKKQTR